MNLLDSNHYFDFFDPNQKFIQAPLISFRADSARAQLIQKNVSKVTFLWQTLQTQIQIIFYDTKRINTLCLYFTLLYPLI